MYSIEVKASSRSYPIYIKNGLLEEIGAEVKKIYKGRKIAVVTDSNVNGFYGQKLICSLKESGFETFKIVVKAGEESKSFETLLEVYDKLLDFKINRGDIIIALGGGVVGDMSGFAAATFLRGIPLIQIPTTLLAQVDSSVGGKVAVDLPRGKNLVGSFYSPTAVFIDPLLLGTLNDKFFSDGMGEVIKYGAIKDSELFYTLMNYENKEALLKEIDKIIYTCLSIKAAIVEDDELDTGGRMLLNYGHTIGHAIEQFFNFEVYSHGEAVAMGMYSITKLGEELGMTKTGTASAIKDILIKYNLPWMLPEIKSENIIETISHDKKNIGESMNFILIESIGNSFIEKINEANIKGYLQKILK
ncbi:3-dehydroquinate synthase [Clostridium sp. CM028]|uniref:3-dehydroquinate synthase n=1 Tax=unclassified Clostridium TaxID=2614128 RepID=UPI001C0D8189|nr:MULTISPECIES: 3-dehydroquinate synthase [unclassified Clostridium]MBU3093343.1 3-dehydroquinate synthase [Clostridium sp. CF011]MBW9147244.1 3-dehydroquinate synthase [Clostridium sp. CM027]MBW9150451.1 3-dehydroquinate synthase [Clostridium sp. CM028]UVE41799.1 3-dehydroquinate synthase [Clostridium sp. CM027]WAG70799.1 3-dehydroquinate synthase [Clostridium sp. CF011]